MKADMKNLECNIVLRSGRRNRQLQFAMCDESAFRAIGKIESGCEIFGFTKGQFSFVDLLSVILDQTGPADVVISTWSAAEADLKRAKIFLQNNKIRSLKFLIDYSFKSRHPEYCSDLLGLFDEDSIRVTVLHSKFAMIKNHDWDIVVRTSMNLNYNPRFENFEISDDPLLYDFMQVLVDEVWNNQAAGEGFSNTPAKNKKQFKRTFQNLGLFDGLSDARDLL